MLPPVSCCVLGRGSTTAKRHRSKGLGQAGISDRRAIIRALASIASYLCADFYIQQIPERILIRTHNFDQKWISKEIRWHDFFEVAMDTYRASDSGTDGEGTSPFQKMIVSIDNDQPAATRSDTRYIITTKDNATIVQDFMEAKSLSLGMMGCEDNSPSSSSSQHNVVRPRQLPFEWRFQIKWYIPEELLMMHLEQMEDPMHYMIPYIRTEKEQLQSCEYAEVKSSKVVKNIAHRLLDDLHQEYSKNSTIDITIGTLLVRRGDKIKLCDTSLATMKNYLKCSFEPIRHKNTLVLYSTDEADANYTGTIRDIIENQIVDKASGSNHHRFLLLDDKIKEQLRRPEVPEMYWNNYHLFLIVKEVMNLSHFALNKHVLSGCKDCSPIRLCDDEMSAAECEEIQKNDFNKMY